MNTRIVLSLVSFLLCSMAWSQEPAQITNTILPVKDTAYTAVSCAFNADDELVKDLLKEIIDQHGGKVKKEKGIIVGKHVKLPDIADNEKDLLFNIISTGRRKKEVTTVTMAVRETDESPLADSSATGVYSRASAWLANLPFKIRIYEKDQALNELKEKLKSVSADLSSLQRSTKKQNRAYGRKTKELKELEEKISDLQKNNN